ncbi:cysteine hydrolase [bacterium]|nr:cysteine hydrolase [bacterium]
MNLDSASFVEWLEARFLPELPDFQWDDGARTAILVIDLVRGFCDQGPLASPRVDALVKPVGAFLQEAQRRGVKHFCFCCDEHPPDSPEFQAFPPHCLAGSSESALHPHLSQLGLGQRFAKGALNGMLETGLPAYLQAHPELDRFVLVGDCTDLCIFQTAMHLRMLANARGLSWQVVVVANLVDTFDLPLTVAQSLGALPHPGDLCHAFALYQLRLNGCRVERYSSISA